MRGPWLPTAACAQLSDNDERQPDLVGQLHRFDDGGFATAKVGVTIRIERLGLMPRSLCVPATRVLVLSAPHRLVDCVLRRQCAFKSGISFPASGDIAKIALTDSLFGQTCAASQGVNCDFIQTLALLPRARAKSGIEVIRNVADRILHASIVGSRRQVLQAESTAQSRQSAR